MAEWTGEEGGGAQTEVELPGSAIGTNVLVEEIEWEDQGGRRSVEAHTSECLSFPSAPHRKG